MIMKKTKRHVLSVGNVHFTQKEVDYIIHRAKGIEKTMFEGSTHNAIKNKILWAYPDWGNMSTTTMFCRFAYREALVQL